MAKYPVVIKRLSCQLTVGSFWRLKQKMAGSSAKWRGQGLPEVRLRRQDLRRRRRWRTTVAGALVSMWERPVRSTSSPCPARRRHRDVQALQGPGLDPPRLGLVPGVLQEQADGVGAPRPRPGEVGVQLGRVALQQLLQQDVRAPVVGAVVVEAPGDERAPVADEAPPIWRHGDEAGAHPRQPTPIGAGARRPDWPSAWAPREGDAYARARPESGRPEEDEYARALPAGGRRPGGRKAAPSTAARSRRAAARARGRLRWRARPVAPSGQDW